MANASFLIESTFNLNPLLQQRFRLPPLRSFPVDNNAFKFNYSTPYKAIRYSPKLRTKCFSMIPKPKLKNVIGENGVPENNDLKAVAINHSINEVLKNILKVLQFPIITGVLLALLFLYNHGCIALAASGGRMGGSAFSSSSRTPKSSSTSSTRSTSSSSSTRPTSSYSSSSSSSSSKRPSSSYSSSSSTSTRPTSSYSSSSSSSSRRPSSSYSSPSSTRPSSSYSSSSRRPESSYSSYSYSTQPESSDSSYSYSTQSPSPSSTAVEDDSMVWVGIIFVVVVVLVIQMGDFLSSSTPHAKTTTTTATTTEETCVVKLQVGLLGMGRSLQRDLNRIAETADTSSPQGLSYILQETILSLLRHPDYCISGYSSVDLKRSEEECEKRFNQLSIEERGKFDEETLVNVNNIRKQSTPSQRTDGFRNEYIVITIIVAASGVHKLPPINNSAQLKEALQKLASIPSSRVLAVEVLWTPQNENDTLTERELLENYSLLRPL